MVIQKADKGNCVVIFEKTIFLRPAETICSDLNKFEKVCIKKGILNFSINCEKVYTIDGRDLENQKLCLPIDIKELKQSEVD